MFVTTKARRRVRTLLPVIGLLGVFAGLASCDDDDDNFVGPFPAGVVATFKDTVFNFATLHTFAMPDTVIHFAPVTGTPLEVSRQFDRAALDRVRQDFIARGYTQVSDPRTVKPDFVVLVGATATTNYNAYLGYSWYGVWGFYPGWGWYAPGFNTSWGIVYPWYPVVGVTAFDRGTLIVDLIPTLSVNPLTSTVSAAWSGAASGLLNGAITSTTITNAIDEMFRLSPYLTASPPLLSRVTR